MQVFFTFLITEKVFDGKEENALLRQFEKRAFVEYETRDVFYLVFI